MDSARLIAASAAEADEADEERLLVAAVLGDGVERGDRERGGHYAIVPEIPTSTYAW